MWVLSLCKPTNLGGTGLQRRLLSELSVCAQQPTILYIEHINLVRLCELSDCSDEPNPYLLYVHFTKCPLWKYGSLYKAGSAVYCREFCVPTTGLVQLHNIWGLLAGTIFAPVINCKQPAHNICLCVLACVQYLPLLSLVSHPSHNICLCVLAYNICICYNLHSNLRTHSGLSLYTMYCVPWIHLYNTLFVQYIFVHVLHYACNICKQ